MIKSDAMHEVDITADELAACLLDISESEPVCILDSCGVTHLGSRFLIAGIEPVEIVEETGPDASRPLDLLDRHLTGERAAVFTLSYELGTRILGIPMQGKDRSLGEPDLFLASFEALIVHDYRTGRTKIVGDSSRCASIRERLKEAQMRSPSPAGKVHVRSNFERDAYLLAIEEIRERIRAGDTYQTNLTHQLTAALDDQIRPGDIFSRLRKEHPSPFAAFIARDSSCVISASPERFFNIGFDGTITTSPIKGTRPRGPGPEEDDRLRQELLSSEKDLAENTMIVDLLRNDLGRVCEFGSIEVDRLCEIEEHPTFFNLVSTIRGKLRDGSKPSDILRAMFPCGSITGAPKISTMKIIDEIECTERGLSMGAIGYYAPAMFGLPFKMDLSVAIRTMVVKENTATFNVGGGITIDSEPENEWDETLVKAKALLHALGGAL